MSLTKTELVEKIGSSDDLFNALDVVLPDSISESDTMGGVPVKKWRRPVVGRYSSSKSNRLRCPIQPAIGLRKTSWRSRRI